MPCQGRIKYDSMRLFKWTRKSSDKNKIGHFHEWIVMSGLVPYESIAAEAVNQETRAILDRLAQTYIVEIEAPYDAIADWYVQIRLTKKPELAGYYGESLQEAATLVAESMKQSAAA